MCGPAKKSRNWFRNFTAAAAFIAFIAPAAAQTTSPQITVSGIAPTSAATSDVVVMDAPMVSASPPRSIVERYQTAAPRSRAPLTLLVQEPQIASAPLAPTSAPGGVVADVIVPPPTRARPVITVSTLSYPATANP